MELVDVVKNSRHVPFIGLAGIAGAGKSYTCTKLIEVLKDNGINALVVGMDGYHYYRSQLDQMADPEEAYARRGAAFTFDAEKFVTDIKDAKESGEGLFPGFDHAVGDPEEGKIHFDRAEHQIVLVEGLYVLLNQEPWKQLQEVFDKTYFIDTDEKCTA